MLMNYSLNIFELKYLQAAAFWYQKKIKKKINSRKSGKQGGK